MAVSKRSSATYNLVNMLFKSIFYSAQYSNLIGDNPTAKINAKGGVPKKEKEALTDAQAKLLLDTIRDLPPYVFVMIGLYSGLRREEILGLQNQLFFSTHSPRKKRGIIFRLSRCPDCLSHSFISPLSVPILPYLSKGKVSGLFLCPKLFDLFSQILTKSDRKK